MSALEVFSYAENELRTFVIEGEPWFVLSDICRVLEISNAANVAARLDEADVRQTNISSGGQRRRVSIVSESGMYEVVIRSDKAEARQFRWWITHEVIPSIRRTGAYAVPETREQLLARAVVEANAAISEAHQQIESLTPRAEAWDELADAGTDYSVGDAAKILQRAGVQTGPQRLFETLREIRWTFRGSDRRWRAYSSAVSDGYLTERAMPPYLDHVTGDLVAAAPQVRVTARGVERLRVRLGVLTNV